nr:endolytic transglycosylase MltG [Oscillospiraceae bacterium]
MDNKEFPGQEEDILPEPIPEAAAEAAPADPPAAGAEAAADEVPVIVELPMTAVPSCCEPVLTAEEDGLPAGEETPAEEIPGECTEAAPAAEAPPVPEEAAQEEEGSIRDGSSFMAHIPDVEEDYPAEEPQPEEIPLPGEPAASPEFPEEPEEIPVDQEYRDADAEFDTMFAAPAEEEKKPDRNRPAYKGRPKRRKGEGLFGIPNILATVVWLALILVIGVTAGRMLWVCAADVLAFGREDKPVTITIYEADTMEDIVDKLHANGLIRYKSLFNLYASISDAEEDIQPGIYDLNTRYDYHALVNFMSPRSSREVVELTIPEGYTCRQIFALLEEHRVCTALDAAAYAANGELNEYWFLDGLERGTENCLEGYLFPDTYEFYKNSTPREALQKMLDNFDYRFTEEMRAQIDTLNASLTGDYTIREITIVASLIEKESAAPAESPKIAGVIYNRLFKWGDNPKLLGIDAAIVYAQEGQAERIDTSIDSPYNTYRNPGLTPGPIANPGLASLKAALNPETHGYYYYVLNPSTGTHQFSATQAEHNAWIDQFYSG